MLALLLIQGLCMTLLGASSFVLGRETGVPKLEPRHTRVKVVTWVAVVIMLAFCILFAFVLSFVAAIALNGPIT
jgi:hypothetical protein